MAIITISRGSYSRGKEVAEKLAEKLNYTCISRDILLEASEEFNIPEIKLVRAIHDAPSILDRFHFGKEKYVAFLQTALLRHMLKDNIIYHGLAGHFLLKGIPHVLKIRIMSNMEDRVAEEMKRENISEKEAFQVLRKDDHERRAWSRYLFNCDPWSPELYDCVFKIGKCTVDDVVNVVMNVAQQSAFKSTPESQKILENKLRTSQVKACLLPKFPRVKTFYDEGIVRVFIQEAGYRKKKSITEAKEILMKSGIKCKSEINVTPVIVH